MRLDNEILFLRWALPKMGYQWEGYRKPRNQVVKRIRRRMDELDLLGGFKEYKTYLENHPNEWRTLDNLCDITISKFFRDRMVWEYLRDEVLAGMMDYNTIQIWSAGCCNGEEAYSLAMVCEQLSTNNEGVNRLNNVKILASDRNEQVLERAMNGQYPDGALRELTDEEIDQYFQELDDEHEEDYEIHDNLRKLVVFEKRDIQNSLPDQMFDLIFCRNLVFTYYTEERQVDFLERLKPRLAKKGYLVTGSNESLPQTSWIKPVSKTHKIYKKS